MPKEMVTPIPDNEPEPAEQVVTGTNGMDWVNIVHAVSEYAAATALVAEYDTNLQPVSLGQPIPYEQLVVNVVAMRGLPLQLGAKPDPRETELTPDELEEQERIENPTGLEFATGPLDVAAMIPPAQEPSNPAADAPMATKALQAESE